ncbi:MAG: ADP-ribosylglycohydrolase family protein, partial [bacterium]
EFYVSGGRPPYKWRVLSGSFPAGLQFQNGRLLGTAKSEGVYPVELQVGEHGHKINRKFELVVRGKNLASTTAKVLSNVQQTDAKRRDAMWLTVGKSLYAENVEVIRDGRRLGKGSTFYSINSKLSKKVDYYGYEWGTPQNIGFLGYHTGSMEENGGWFTSLNVEYRDKNGHWKSVEDLVISPSLPPGEKPFNKPHFVEYLLAFKPVQTTAIRIIGKAGGAKHWYSKLTHFTSITELSAHGPLAGYDTLEQ